jgi:cephalosporin hydroxylase
MEDNEFTDKNTVHSYLPLYRELLKTRKDTAKNVLEIGVAGGGSILMWHDYFQHSNVYGLDIMLNPIDFLENKERVKLRRGVSAYDTKVVENFGDLRFDFLLDDGPHTLESMMFFVEHYSKLMTDDGILIIEDIQSPLWINHILAKIPPELHKNVKTYNLMFEKNRYDDLVLVIDKSRSLEELAQVELDLRLAGRIVV